MKRLLLTFLIGFILIGPKAHGEEKTVLRSVQFEPCNGEAVYIFIMSDGQAIAFGLDYVRKHDQALALFLSLLRNEDKHAKGKTIIVKQHCPKEGVGT